MSEGDFGAQPLFTGLLSLLLIDLNSLKYNINQYDPPPNLLRLLLMSKITFIELFTG